MATQTKRDKVWDVSLELAREQSEFDVSEVLAESGLDACSRRTARDVLTTMTEQGWLESRTCRETGRRVYFAGERFP